MLKHFMRGWFLFAFLFLGAGDIRAQGADVVRTVPSIGELSLWLSGVEELEEFIGEPIRCGEPTGYGDPDLGIFLTGCRSESPDTERHMEAYLSNGRLVMLRYMPVFSGPAEQVVRRLEQDNNQTATQHHGEQRSVRDLRYWDLSWDGHTVVVAEVRLIETGEQRVRISLVLSPEYWDPLVLRGQP